MGRRHEVCVEGGREDTFALRCSCGTVIYRSALAEEVPLGRLVGLAAEHLGAVLTLEGAVLTITARREDG